MYGIIADPISHVQTPQILNALMAEKGADGVMVPLHVSTAELPAFVDGLRAWRNFGGFIATVPHKTAIMSLCDEISENAKLVGAVNVVRRHEDGSLSGDILDGIGFVEGLRRSGREPKGSSAFLAGAGGAAKAIAFALADSGIERLTIYNRTHEAAADLRIRLGERYPGLSTHIGSSDPSGHQIVINATSLGLHHGDCLPLDVEKLQPPMVVADIIMAPEITALLAAAREAGCQIHVGRPMLDGQVHQMARFMGMMP